MREREELHNPHMGNCITSVTDLRGSPQSVKKAFCDYKELQNVR